jgi:hypothetical protein
MQTDLTVGEGRGEEGVCGNLELNCEKKENGLLFCRNEKWEV